MSQSHNVYNPTCQARLFSHDGFCAEHCLAIFSKSLLTCIHFQLCMICARLKHWNPAACKLASGTSVMLGNVAVSGTMQQGSPPCLLGQRPVGLLAAGYASAGCFSATAHSALAMPASPPAKLLLDPAQQEPTPQYR